MSAEPTPVRQCSAGWSAGGDAPAGWPLEPLRGALPTVALLTALVGATAAIGLLERATGARFSLAMFFCLPVAAAVWWGGPAQGALVALAGVVAWHWSDQMEAAWLVRGGVRFAFFVGFGSLLTRLRVALVRQTALAGTDALTGVANGRVFYERVSEELERGRREPRPLTLVYLDVDNFKHVNDRLGHAAGDDLLRRVAATLGANVRPLDTLARLGGDEFALLLPETGAAAARAVLERLREALAEEMAEHCWPVTFSIGAATFLRPCEAVDALVHGVDALMYRAKKGGKDRIRHEIVTGRITLDEGDSYKAERRASARLACGRTAAVRTADGPVVVARVRDISLGGVAVVLDRPMDVGAALTIERLDGAGPRLRARVVRTLPEGDGWLHGCLLAGPLDADELRRWTEQAGAEPGAPAAVPEPAAGG